MTNLPLLAHRQSHHRPREGPFELNDVFAIINAVPAIALLAYGFFNAGLVPGLCFGAVSPPIDHFFPTTFRQESCSRCGHPPSIPTHHLRAMNLGPWHHHVRNGLHVHPRRSCAPPLPRWPHRRRALLAEGGCSAPGLSNLPAHSDCSPPGGPASCFLTTTAVLKQDMEVARDLVCSLAVRCVINAASPRRQV